MEHFTTFSELTGDRRVFVGLLGADPDSAELPPVWRRALERARPGGIHVHDLRQTGNHFAAMSGASTRELMGRMGHVSVDAALVYQHRTAVRDRAIADSLDAVTRALNVSRATDAANISGHVVGTEPG